MSIEDALFTRLSTHPGLSALVGDRVYPEDLPQNPTMPAVTYQRISTRRVRSMTGPSGLAMPRIQVTCWGKSTAEARDVATQARFALDGLAATVGGVVIQAAWADNELGIPDPDRGLKRRVIDFIVAHEEAVV